MKIQRQAILVVDLGYGDAGKGTIIDYLGNAQHAHTVVRFNGGAQAGHNVVMADGRHHTFSQFGSAMFVPGVETYLSRSMIISPLAMLSEEQCLRGKGVLDALERTTVSEDALVITPFQRAANRLRERARGDQRHGSCGVGIGETVSDSLCLGDGAVRVRDCIDRKSLAKKFALIRDYKRDNLKDALAKCKTIKQAREEIESFEDENLFNASIDGFLAWAQKVRIVNEEYTSTLLQKNGTILFEGAQGVLLDERRGFHPYTTWSVCTFKNGQALLAEHAYSGDVTRLGVVRAYATRHGPGPFVTENARLTKLLPDEHNTMHEWQRAFRVGWFDSVATRYAIDACDGIDALAVTCLDRLQKISEWKVCIGYKLPSGALTMGIRLCPEGDLVHQENLTEMLFKAKPLYGVSAGKGKYFEEKVASHLDVLSRSFNVPVIITSFGPQAKQKRSMIYSSLSP